MNVPVSVIHIPHASTLVPASARSSIALSEEDLQRELLTMTDHFTDDLFRVPENLAKAVTFPVSRLVVDPERFVNDRDEPMAAKGMGVIYTLTSSGQPLRKAPSTQERDELLSTYYLPHHLRLAQEVDAALAVHDRCLIVDAHSFPARPLPYEAYQDPDRCDICVGTDPFHTPTWLADLTIHEFRNRGYLLCGGRSNRAIWPSPVHCSWCKTKSPWKLFWRFFQYGIKENSNLQRLLRTLWFHHLVPVYQVSLAAGADH